MNRVIKFRAYNSRLKELIYNPHLWGSSRGGIDDLNTSLIRMANDEKYSLMQFTGLQDKNGVDIYEGDLMQSAKPFNKPLAVMWDDETASFLLNYGDTSYLVSDESLEVIGNIFENPELIESK